MTTLKTQRLCLRPPRIEDFEPYAAFYADTERGSAFAPHNLDRETVWARLLRWVGHWQAFGFGAFLAWQADALIGEVGIGYFKRSVTLAMDAAPEAFWRVAPDHRREGLAREAMTAILDWADRAPAVPASVCMIDPANHVSEQFARSLRFVEFARAAYKDRTMMLMRRE